MPEVITKFRRVPCRRLCGDVSGGYDPGREGEEGVEGIDSEKYREGVVEGVIDEAMESEDGKQTLPTVPKP
jgi:hypothetical protein